MIKSKKFLIICSLILAVAVIVIVIVIINLYPLISMKPSATGEITNTDIFAIKNKMNSLYFIKSSDDYILVDAGSDVETIIKDMNESKIDPLKVKYILLTHSDSDHVAALELFVNATIYMSEDELQMIDGTTKRSSNKSNSLPNKIADESFILLDDIVLVGDGEKLIFNDKEITCIKTPGHTPGSMSFLVDGDYLFTGDAIRIKNNSLDIHPFSMDTETSKKSITKIETFIENSKMILTGHYGHFESNKFIIKD